MFNDKLNANPMIAAVKNLKYLDIALNSPAEIIFLLSGDIFNLKEIVQKAHEQEKIIFIHVDLIDGFSRDAVALQYIHQKINPDGIISTKSSQLKMAKELNLLTIQRFFIIDSLSLSNAVKSTFSVQSDAIEIMPGVMPKIIRQISNQIHIPLIAGGLINEKEDIITALSAGATAVSSTNRTMWNM